MNFKVLPFSLSLLVLGSWVVFGDDWPSWFGPENGSWKQSGTIDHFVEDKADFVWRKELGTGYSGASVSNGRLVVMDRVKNDTLEPETDNALRRSGQIPGLERVLCLDSKTGALKWSHSYDCPYRIAYPSGPRCTPTIDSDRVYTLGAMGNLICFQTSDGKVVWEKNLLEEYETKPPLWGYAIHPFIDGDKLIVAVGGDGSGLVAFDKVTGREIWKAVTTFDIAYAPLVMHEHENVRQLIFWHAEAVEGLNPETGSPYWSVKFPDEKNDSQVCVATPRIFGNKLLISEYYKGSLLLELKSNPPAVQEIWRSSKIDPEIEDSLNCLMTTPVVKDGYAYGVANDPRGKGIFRCTKLDTGATVWTKTDWMTKEPETFASAFIVENGDKYFVFNDVGELMIVRLSPEGFEELDRVQVLEATGAARGRQTVWCQPAFADGCMYVRNDKEIVCVNLLKKE